MDTVPVEDRRNLGILTGEDGQAAGFSVLPIFFPLPGLLLCPVLAIQFPPCRIGLSALLGVSISLEPIPTGFLVGHLALAFRGGGICRDLRGPVLHRAHDRGDKALIGEGCKAGEAFALVQQPFAVQLFDRLDHHVHHGQGRGSVQIVLFRLVEGRRGLSGPVGVPDPQKTLCGLQEGSGGLLNPVGVEGIEHFTPGAEVAPEADGGVAHGAAPQDALAAFRDRAFQFPLPGVLGPLSGSPGRCGLFRRLYAAFKLRNLACKLAIFVFF